MVRGEQVRLVFNSTDTTVAAAISLVDAEGTPRSLAVTERLVLVTIVINAQTTVVGFDFFDDINGDGNVETAGRLWSKNSATGVPQFAMYPGEGMPCGKGRLPKVKGSAAGIVDITGIGYIIKG